MIPESDGQGQSWWSMRIGDVRSGTVSVAGVRRNAASGMRMLVTSGYCLDEEG